MGSRSNLIEKYCEKFNNSNHEIESQEMNIVLIVMKIEKIMKMKKSHIMRMKMMIIFVMMMKYLNSQDIIEKTVLERTDLFSILKKDEFLKEKKYFRR